MTATNFTLDFISDGVSAGVAADHTSVTDALLPQQTHSCNAGVILPDAPMPCLDDTDAIISLRRGVKIGVRTADCVPVVVYSPDIRAVAAIHAGWKGTLSGITQKTMELMLSLGADLSLAEAAFGPCICGQCYEISEELSRKFRHAGYSDCFPSHRHLDLQAANRKQLLAAGLQTSLIHPSPCCTLQTAAFPSWRRTPTGQRLLTWIALH